MQKVYVNGYYLTQDIAGVQRFATNVLQHLDQLLVASGRQFQIICLVPKSVTTNFKAITLKVVKSHLRVIDNSQTLWEQIVLPLASIDGLLLNLCNFAPLFKKNQLVVLHDVIPFYYPESCSWQFRLFFRVMTQIFVRRVKFMATVSHSSAAEILAVTKSSREILVLGNSGEHLNSIDGDDSILKKMNLTPKRYLFTVSSQADKKYKNFSLLMASAKLLNLPLVAVGVAQSNLKITYTGRVSDAELKSLYSNAFLFIFPSLYEGFGIPPLEAIVCGTPVIASDIPVLREVCANAALYFDPYSVDSLTALVNTLSLNHELYQKLHAACSLRAQFYSWHEIAKQVYLLLYANSYI